MQRDTILTEQEKFDLPRRELPVPSQLLIDLLGALSGLLLVGRQRATHVEADQFTRVPELELNKNLPRVTATIGRRGRRKVVHAAAGRTPNTPCRTDITCCSPDPLPRDESGLRGSAFEIVGKGRRIILPVRISFLPSSLLSSFQLVFYFALPGSTRRPPPPPSRQPPVLPAALPGAASAAAAQEENRLRGLLAHSSPICRSSGLGGSESGALFPNGHRRSKGPV